MRVLQRGFTLGETLIVLVIVAVLAAIAVPSYQSIVRKSRRADAKAALLELQLSQEKWRANNVRYSDSVEDLDILPATVTSYYRVSVADVSATTFTLRATAIDRGGQDRDTQSGTSCASLTLNQSGTGSPEVCWR